ncbi:MAG: LysR substrate-binding domain-containing protein [Azospirillaceae bacterium]
MISFRQLRALIGIADHLHFRRAAETLHITQPALSTQLRQLEAQLGVTLVERSRSHVILTPVGEAIAERGRLILRDVEELSDIARHSLQPFTGTIRLGVLPTIGPYLMPHVLPGLHAAYPRLKIYVREGKADDLLTQLTQGNFDLLILPLPIERQGVQVRPLAVEPLLVALSVEHRLAGRKALRRSDLAGEEVLIMESGHRLHEQAGALCEEIGARALTDYEGTSLDALRQMVGLGIGITFLPQLYARLEAEKDTQVVTLPVIDRPPYRELAVLWRARSPLSEELTTIADAIREWLSDAIG